MAKRECKMNFGDDVQGEEGKDNYYPSGSLSSNLDSRHNTDEELNSSIRVIDRNICEEFLGISPMIIPYEPLTSQKFVKLLTDEEKERVSLESKETEIGAVRNGAYEKLLKEFNVLNTNYRKLQDKLIGLEFQQRNNVKCSCGDRDYCKKIEEEKKELRKDFIITIKKIKSVQRENKLIKNEMIAYREKIKLFESEIFQIKHLIEGIAGEDAMHDSNINEPNFFVSLKIKLNAIKSKLKACSNKPNKKIEKESKIIELIIDQDIETELSTEKKNFSLSRATTCKNEKAVNFNFFNKLGRNTFIKPSMQTKSVNEDEKLRFTFKDIVRDLQELNTNSTKAMRNDNFAHRSVNYKFSNLF